MKNITPAPDKPYVQSPDYDHDYGDCITCPYCLEKDQEHTDYPKELFRDGGSVEYECHACERLFVVSVDVSYSYSSQIIDPTVPREAFEVSAHFLDLKLPVMVTINPGGYDYTIDIVDQCLTRWAIAMPMLDRYALRLRVEHPNGERAALSSSRSLVKQGVRTGDVIVVSQRTDKKDGAA